MAKVDWRSLVLVLVIGVCVAMFTGAVENPRGEIGIPGLKHYGYPLVWRVAHTPMPDEFRFLELFVDCLFWFVIVFIIVLFIKKLTKV